MFSLTIPISSGFANRRNRVFVEPFYCRKIDSCRVSTDHYGKSQARWHSPHAQIHASRHRVTDRVKNLNWVFTSAEKGPSLSFSYCEVLCPQLHSSEYLSMPEGTDDFDADCRYLFRTRVLSSITITYYFANIQSISVGP